MRAIKIYVDAIEEEIADAKNYAEHYVERKAMGDAQAANRYKEMSNDELKHAGYLHEWAVREIEKIATVYTAPVEMQEKWEQAHKKYVEKTAMIKQMLAM